MSTVDLPLEILHEDASCLVVNKPSGVLTQAPPGIDSIEVRVRRYLQRSRPGAAGQTPYVGVPHRLDRPATGALCFGTSRKMTRKIAEQFQGRLVRKIYWTLVAGLVRPVQGTWEDYVRKIPDRAFCETVPADHPDGRVAVLRYRVLQQTDQQSWLQIELETGRTHQIRVQSSSRGHAILGDEMYGSEQPFGPTTSDIRQRHIALHARQLQFSHPKTGDPVSIEAPLPVTWQDWTESLTVSEEP